MDVRLQKPHFIERLFFSGGWARRRGPNQEVPVEALFAQQFTRSLAVGARAVIKSSPAPAGGGREMRDLGGQILR